jgi:cytoskeletal protein CcmA (bactofilin family)
MFHVKRIGKTHSAVTSAPDTAPLALTADTAEATAITESRPPVTPPAIPQLTQGAEMGVVHMKDESSRRDTTKGALLGRGSKFEGKLTFEGIVQIDGEFYGDISSEGELIVGEAAKIEGTIQVTSASISGEVVGTITTTGTLELRPTARVTGELNIESLVVARGAYFDGQVKMTGRGT